MKNASEIFRDLPNGSEFVDGTELVSMPICPYCKATMEPENYEGYYDSFSCWTCDCEKIPNAEKTYGEYAC